MNEKAPLASLPLIHPQPQLPWQIAEVAEIPVDLVLAFLDTFGFATDKDGYIEGIMAEAMIGMFEKIKGEL